MQMPLMIFPMNKFCLLAAVCFIVFANATIAQNAAYNLIDKNATAETKSLFHYLHATAGKHILFGHQHATEYGHGWYGDSGRSDVKSVTGSHPAVIGVDFSGLSGRLDSEIVNTQNGLRKNISDTYDRGGITTVAWHFNNPVSKGGFYWVDSISKPAVSYIIPGGSYNYQYKKILQTVAGLAKSVKGKDGKLVPMIFRPFHELDGGWFWWGKPHCTQEEFVTLWRFTVSYLRDSLDVHNFIYAFSPDCKFTNEAEYLERYPGDAFVDMVGVDNYADFGRDGKYNLEAGINKLKVVDGYAKKAGKLAAFTETGLESLPNNTWWVETLLKALKTDDMNLSYVLVWRNDTRSPTHFYAPFPGHSSVPDFINFYNDPYTFFEKDLEGVYK
ncbi:glycosyl hydrolase [soil metagenome]